jgi:phenylpropionate dioxygenase-like ring-hydroxylating dioxygenase large terminal subunit
LTPRPHLIPKERYTSEDWLRAEIRDLWPRVWLHAGLLSDLREPGSYFTFEIGVESILVVRQESGVRAFHNVCRHRGRRLREPGSGRAKAFQCPYHGWTWSTDGRLLSVPDLETFPQGVPPDQFGLVEVHCTAWAGFVWVCLDRDPPSLAEYLGPVAPFIEAYHLESYAPVEDLSVDLACNWKVAVDAFNESYHLRHVHPAILGIVDDVRSHGEVLGRHSRLVVPFYQPSSRLPDRSTVSDTLKWLATEAGLSATDAAGPASEIRGRVQRSIRDRQAAGELDTGDLSDDQLVENNHFHVFPNLQLDAYALKLMLLRHRPHPTDPGRMILDQQWFQRVPEGAPRPPRPGHSEFAFGKGSLGTNSDQDTFNLIRVQQGMQSSGLDGLVLGNQEICLQHMHDVLSKYIRPEGMEKPRSD